MKVDDPEKEGLTKRDEENDKDKKKKKKGKKKKKHKDSDSDEDSDERDKKSAINDDTFKILNRYNLIKMLGSGSFGEIHLAIDTHTDNDLKAIKFELSTIKNPQLKHENNIIEHLNKIENNLVCEGIPKVYGFDRIEGKCNFMVMDFLGPTLSDLFQFKSKQFSLQTVLLIGLQMLQRIEYVHEKGFIHRDIKPENFLIGLDDRSNIIHIIDFGLSKRYKEKSSGQHIAYRENRNLVGTARYASINAHLGIEQSRRDDIESIGFVLVYFLIGRLPWQSKNDKGKYPNKIMEKKLITPPEILCKKLPMEFAYYFHYCKNLKFEDRPDYTALKALFYDVLMRDTSPSISGDYTFDWFEDSDQNKDDEDKNVVIETKGFGQDKNNENKDVNLLGDRDEDNYSPRSPEIDTREKDQTLKGKKSAFSFNLSKNDVVKRKKSDEGELDKINSDESDSGESDDDNQKPDIKKKNIQDSFNSNKISDDEDDKKTEKYSNRSHDNDEIVRQIITNDDKKSADNNFQLLKKGLSEKDMNSSSENHNRNDAKLYVRGEYQEDKEKNLVNMDEIRLDINK